MTRAFYMLILIVCLGAGAASAQDATSEFRARVVAQDANVRALPTLESDVIASVFEDDTLEVVGRNLDGTWFEVRRPGRFNNLGWVHYTLLNWDFRAEFLPLTDTTTGLTGETLLEGDTGFAVYLYAETVMRRLPFDGERIGSVPFGVIVPVRGRNQNGSWLLVNYLGLEGWINIFYTRRLPDVMAVPEIPGLPPLEPPTTALVIPPDVQVAEIQQFRDYILSHYDFTFELEGFWAKVFEGDVMPCEPPPFVEAYLYSTDDERAFPELEYLVPRLGEGLDYINHSIETMYTCGVVNPRLVITARNDAINARFVFQATLDVLDNMEYAIRNR